MIKVQFNCEQPRFQFRVLSGKRKPPLRQRALKGCPELPLVRLLRIGEGAVKFTQPIPQAILQIRRRGNLLNERLKLRQLFPQLRQMLHAILVEPRDILKPFQNRIRLFFLGAPRLNRLGEIHSVASVNG